MSLTTTTPPKQYRLGIIASKALDDPDFLPELIAPHVSAISHIYTNGANPLVCAAAASMGIPLTVFPLTGGRSLPWSTSLILDNVDFVYIVSDPDSKSTAQVAADCAKRSIRHKVIPYTPFAHWQAKVGKVAEILAATTHDEVQANGTLRAIWEVV